MEGWALFGFWLLIVLGLLWVKRQTGLLRCKAFSAALAGALFVGIFMGFYYLALLHDGSSKALVVASFLFVVLGLIPLSSGLTLLLAKLLIPFFQVETVALVRCAVYLSAWTYVALLLFSWLKIFAFLLLGAGFGGGMPRVKTRVFDNDYYF
ncbi:MAG: hypothetical protein ACRDEA_23315 [Microcystaceae cyanobacterium]